VVSWIAQAIWNAGSRVSSAMSGIIGWAAQAIWNAGSWFVTAAWGVIQWIADAFWNAGSRVSNAMWAVMGWVKDAIWDVANSMWNWGWDMMTSLANGIKANMSKPVDAIKSLVQKIADKIKCSVPKEGPLSTADEWMPDMMNLFTKGIIGGFPQLEYAVNGIASILAGVNTPDFAGVNAKAMGTVGLQTETNQKAGSNTQIVFNVGTMIATEGEKRAFARDISSYAATELARLGK